MYVIEISDVTHEYKTLNFVLCLTFGVKNKPFGFSSQIDALSQNQGFLYQNFIVQNVHAHSKNKFQHFCCIFEVSIFIILLI